jgi:lipoprotein-anchoring transpeptidase ErfK/SrfK
MAEVSSRTELRRKRLRRRRITIVTAISVVVVLLAAGGFFVFRDDGSTTAAPPTSTAPVARASTGITATFAAAPLRAAITKGGNVAVYPMPDPNTTPISTLTPSTDYQFPRSFLVFDRYQDWLHVYLPARPNSSTGWIKASDVSLLNPTEYEVKVTLATHTLTLLHNGAVELQAPAATGTSENPTPTGTFFFTDPLDLSSQPDTAYGVFAIGLSGHSNTLSDFNGGDGQIAIHGTNDPSSIGTNVSHGCVRVNNDIILRLSKLPIGTPVVIT